ncbi:pirin family protein [Alteromonas gracilis]|uniref:pirin family protein n=1 Tax=Alteromonas gracilis TaxID=1479524 RepID=UPI00321A9016
MMRTTEGNNNPLVMNSNVSQPVAGTPFSVGQGFNALSFRHHAFQSGFDPLIMVDHYHMHAPTFGAHPHAGLSAVTLLFEDSQGKFHNTDSLGNDFDMLPGDLYWLKSGASAVHDERPREGGTAHGLQMFVNIPNAQKNDAPETMHVKASDMPVITKDSARVRVVLGEYLHLQSAVSPSVPMTILDGKLLESGRFGYHAKAQSNSWIYAVSGALTIHINGAEIALAKGESITLEANEHTLDAEFLNAQGEPTQFAVVSATPLNETFVQQGPLVAANDKAMKEVIARLSK